MPTMKMLSAPILVALCANTSTAQQTARNQPALSLGYATVALALESMRSKEGVETSVQEGWTVIEDPSTLSLWSFTYPGHSAHPSAVHRQMIRDGDAFFVKMNVLCEASKPACDKLVAEFQSLNEQMQRDLEGRKNGKP